MSKESEINQSVMIENKDLLPANFYNTILPVMQCPHCGLELATDKVWDYFRPAATDKLRSNMILFDSLLQYPEKDLIVLFEKV